MLNMKTSPEENLKNWRRLRRIVLLGMCMGIHPAYHGLSNYNNLLEFIIIETIMIGAFIKCTSMIWKIKEGIHIIKLLKAIYKKKYGQDMPDCDSDVPTENN